MNSTTSIFQRFYWYFKNAVSSTHAAPMYWLKSPLSNLEDHTPLLPHMFSTENLGQTSMWVTTNFQRGKIQRQRKIIFVFFHCYFLWLTHFLNLLSFLHELTISTSAQEFCQILSIREILSSSRENLFLLNTEDSSSVNLNSINEFTKLEMSV